MHLLSVDLAIERTRDEAAQAATLLLAGHADVRGLRQACTDWVMEEVLIGYEGSQDGGHTTSMPGEAFESRSPVSAV
jgi:hypothetical protein